MLSVRIRDQILQRVYMMGYAGHDLPRLVRSAIAGSAIHRAWFLGHTGHFEEMGICYGLANPYLHSKRMEQAE